MSRGTTAAIAAAIVVVMMMLSSCVTVEEWKADPVRAKARAELAGSATVYTFFISKPDMVKKAGELKVTVDVIKAKLTSTDQIGAGGFTALMPAINEELKKRLTGDDIVYLPPASLLVQLLLVELDSNTAGGDWSADAVIVRDVADAFLRGASDALRTYASLSP
jgi:hypothetical protein